MVQWNHGTQREMKQEDFEGMQNFTKDAKTFPFARYYHTKHYKGFLLVDAIYKLTSSSSLKVVAFLSMNPSNMHMQIQRKINNKT